MQINDSDKKIVQELARKVAEIGHDPIQEEKKRLWKNHNALRRQRPMVLCFPEGSWCELLPSETLKCQDPVLRKYEWFLRSLIYRWEHLHDDYPIEPRIKVPIVVRGLDWGIPIQHKESGVNRGAWAFNPVIKEPSDLKKLKKPTIELDEEATNRELELAHELFDGILPVKRKGLARFDCSLLYMLCEFIGLENILYYVADRPEFVHEAMSFMTNSTLEMLESAEKQGLIETNNEDDYICSGGVGYTDELPTSGSQEKGYSLMDCWGFAEAQEFSEVSAKMHYEFVLQYQIKMLSKYGLNTYGCCEPVSDRFDIIFKIPRLRKVSISPWADIEKSAEALRDKIIFSWKPNPADLAGESFDPDLIRRKIKNCVNIAKGCVLEMTMKDTHTLRHEPFRLSEWVRIAREIAEDGYPN